MISRLDCPTGRPVNRLVFNKVTSPEVMALFMNIHSFIILDITFNFELVLPPIHLPL